MAVITVSMPEGLEREIGPGTRAADLATRLKLKRPVAVLVDDQLRDLATPLEMSCQVRFVVREDPAALELIRHDLAHVMAQAVTELFPSARPTIGPVVENGFYYDFDYPQAFSAEDLARIEERMVAIVTAAVPLEREVWERSAARQFFADRDEKFKVELVDAIPVGEEVTMYRQGSFIDLCRGPHMPTTAYAGRAFKLMRVAGSYWRGDAHRERLQRIYGVAWAKPADLRAHLTMLAEAERRDHRKLGVAMDLFHLQDEAAGSVFWHDRGWIVYRELEAYMRARQRAAGYLEVRTPQLVDRSLWERSGHWDKFRAHMYLTQNEAGIGSYAEDSTAPIFGLKPMNCPCHVLIYRRGVKSYRDLPLRMAEFGCCHRCEPTGALHGLMRARAFTQDDAHIFCTPEQVVAETAAFVRLLAQVYADLGFDEFVVRLADRPPLRAGSDAVWDVAEQSLREACEQAAITWQPNAGEGAFYGPKLEFVLRDAIGREWQCGTWQVDFVLPERLDAEYVARDGTRRRPVMLHRAILGSFERFIGILLEHGNGRLPLWLAPVQVVVAAITAEVEFYAHEVQAAFQRAGLRTELDLRNEKIGYKIRAHSVAKVPVIVAVGNRELAARTVNLRRLGESRTETISLASACERFMEEATPPYKKTEEIVNSAKDKR